MKFLFLQILYIVNYSWWKSFTVAELNCNLLRHSWLDGSLSWPRPIAQSILQEKFYGYWLIHKSSKTFPPWLICNIQYLGFSYMHYFCNVYHICSYVCTYVTVCENLPYGYMNFGQKFWFSRLWNLWNTSSIKLIIC